MTIEEANRLLISSLGEIYDERESASITALVMERLTGMPKSLRVIHKTEPFNSKQNELLATWLGELLRFRPVQYVLGEAWFGSYAFYVNEVVLIPRPETEELVTWLLKDNQAKPAGTLVLDIGTGSGCIPVFLKKKRKDFTVRALDVSPAALEIALRNSTVNDAEIDFILCDIRDPQDRSTISPVDILISNPPYIPEFQRESLAKQVREYEPGLALFVPDSDPLLFYKIIGNLAKEKLNAYGLLYLEVHHDFAHATEEWYLQNGFYVETRKDLSGNNRMIKAWIK